MIIKPEKEVSKALYEQIVALKDKEACYRFFQDLCSITELRAMEHILGKRFCFIFEKIASL